MNAKLQNDSSRGRVAILISYACVLALALGLAACETMRVGSDYDRTADFTNYHSFTWLPREEYGVRNPLVVERAREAIQARLQQKGYTYTSDPAAADFAVDFTIGAHDRTDIHTYPQPYGSGWYWYGPRWWGYPYWGTGIDVHQYREGVLAVDAFDARTHKPVWHGWAKKALTRRDMEQSGQSIREAADAVLAKFPPG
ncbi:MAG: DUF4136 domain-containing protein [Gammaproteobacteria bacterium]|nr:DUF4136 domain-containing protein [Gammaproteobacteria bacterium]MDE2263116.1 DUF4136 domain-containing protein [Gammaproteobacteria bacterium]